MDGIQSDLIIDRKIFLSLRNFCTKCCQLKKFLIWFQMTKAGFSKPFDLHWENKFFIKLNMALKNYDGEYQNQLNLARKLILKIKDKQDRAIALKYINLVTSLNANDPTVKRNRNAFFQYFLEVLENHLSIEAKQTIVCTCPIANEEALSDPLKYLQKEVLQSGEKVTSHWSKDKRSYVSAKIIPGRGALLYMAVSSDPDCEWDIRSPQTKSQVNK